MRLPRPISLTDNDALVNVDIPSTALRNIARGDLVRVYDGQVYGVALTNARPGEATAVRVDGFITHLYSPIKVFPPVGNPGAPQFGTPASPATPQIGMPGDPDYAPATPAIPESADYVPAVPASPDYFPGGEAPAVSYIGDMPSAGVVPVAPGVIDLLDLTYVEGTEYEILPGEFFPLQVVQIPGKVVECDPSRQRYTWMIRQGVSSAGGGGGGGGVSTGQLNAAIATRQPINERLTDLSTRDPYFWQFSPESSGVFYLGHFPRMEPTGEVIEHDWDNDGVVDWEEQVMAPVLDENGNQVYDEFSDYARIAAMGQQLMGAQTVAEVKSILGITDGAGASPFAQYVIGATDGADFRARIGASAGEYFTYGDGRNGSFQKPAGASAYCLFNDARASQNGPVGVDQTDKQWIVIKDVGYAQTFKIEMWGQISSAGMPGDYVTLEMQLKDANGNWQPNGTVAFSTVATVDGQFGFRTRRLSPNARYRLRFDSAAAGKPAYTVYSTTFDVTSS